MTARRDWPEWPVCRVADIADPGAAGFLVGDGEWPFRGFVVRNAGEFSAYANICPHARHPLDTWPDEFLTGTGGMIRCGWHGALFMPDSGECVAGPCMGAALLHLPVRVDADGCIWVRAPGSMRDAALENFTGE